jgi:hypothetical protein
MEGRVPVMSVSIPDFKRGDIVILAEGAPGVYGKYKVAECDGGSIAVLAEYSFGGAFRYILKPYSGEEEAPFGMGNPHVLYKSVLWSSGSSNLGGGADDKSQTPYEVLVDVVRVFPDGDEAAADEYLKAVVAARDLLACEGGRVSCDVPVAPLNNRLSNPHVVRSGDVDGIVAALEAGADSKFERFLQECAKFRDSIIYFAVSEWDYLDAFMKKVESEPTCLGSEYAHLVDGATGITPVGLFVGDIIRVGVEGIEYLQVIDVAPDGFKMKNLTRGGIDVPTLVIKSERVEDKKSGETHYIYRLVLEGVIVDEWCYCFAVLPTRNPALIPEFDALYTMQSKLIGKFDEGVQDSLHNWEEAVSVKATKGFSVKAWWEPDYAALLEELDSLVNKARYSGSILRLENLQDEVIDAIATKVEVLEADKRERITKLREALETVAALNS